MNKTILLEQDQRSNPSHHSEQTMENNTEITDYYTFRVFKRCHWKWVASQTQLGHVSLGLVRLFSSFFKQ